MKVRVEIDCTPGEARAFLGLPDVGPMQEKLLQEMQERMTANLQAMDPQEIVRQWFSPNFKGLEKMFEVFSQAGGPKRE